MQDSANLVVLAIFILLLALSLLGLFLYLVKSSKADTKEAVTRIQANINKIRNLDNFNDRTFKEFQLLVNRRLRDALSPHKTATMAECDCETQTEQVSGDVEQGKQDAALQTDMVRVTSLPPLLVRPALSSDVVIPISQ